MVWVVGETRHTRHTNMMVTRATLRARGDVKLPPQQGPRSNKGRVPHRTHVTHAPNTKRRVVGALCGRTVY
jgi:hypothetical protein